MAMQVPTDVDDNQIQSVRISILVHIRIFYHIFLLYYYKHFPKITLIIYKLYLYIYIYILNITIIHLDTYNINILFVLVPRLSEFV